MSAINRDDLEHRHEVFDEAVSNEEWDKAAAIISDIRATFGEETAERLMEHYKADVLAKIGEYDATDLHE
jgi:bifunctional ADP-heptose synthase (sugar kinase/adenylyltransferase)